MIRAGGRLGSALLFLLALTGNSAYARLRIFVPETSTKQEATSALQAFLNSDADTLVFTSRYGELQTGPLVFGQSNRTLILLPGFVLRAAAHGFESPDACLFSMTHAKNVTVLGYGAKWLMRKTEYGKGEWRHALNLLACANVRIEGLEMDSSGGDGVYLSGTRGQEREYDSGIVLENCRASGNLRQGVSVISAQELLIKGCVFTETSGTPPQDGIDFEPNGPEQRLIHCEIRNCVFSANRGDAGQVELPRLNASSEPVSIHFESCLFSGSDAGRGVEMSGGMTAQPRENVSFDHCFFQGSSSHTALMVRQVDPEVSKVSFNECEFEALGEKRFWRQSETLVALLSGGRETRWGGISFRNCIFRAPNLPVFDLDPKNEVRLRNLRIDGYFEAPVPKVPAQAEITALAQKPDWPPPPPMLQSFAALGDGCRVTLGNWSHDSVFYSDRGTWRIAPWGVKVYLRAGETLRTVSRRRRSVSDTLIFRAPAYLRRDFPGLGLYR